ncbi:MAG TPA: hypothetical protein VKF81_07485 [Blastocatellia bacterium]|nr:hypothetical protein [Blastocatellia bacterium]
MSESEGTTSWWSIVSNVMAVLAIGAAFVALKVLFPAGTESGEGNEHVAIAIEAVLSFALAAHVALLVALLGGCAGIIGLLLWEPKWPWAVLGIQINALVLTTLQVLSALSWYPN